MKKTGKRLLALLLVAMMVLSSATAVFADEPAVNADGAAVESVVGEAEPAEAAEAEPAEDPAQAEPAAEAEGGAADEATVADSEAADEAGEAAEDPAASLNEAGDIETPEVPADQEPTAETFGFTLQVGQYTEGADFHTASFEGVTYALKDADGKVYEPSSTSTGSLSYSKLPADKTYTFTASKEGWAVVTQGEWNVDAHAYEYTFTGETEIKVTITKADADKNITEATNKGMILRKIPDNLVVAALEKVPADLSIFTDDTAKAVEDAVAKADKNEMDIEKQTAMADAIVKALQGLQPKDGSYTCATEATGKGMFKIVDVISLDVVDGKMTLHFLPGSQTYPKIYIGTTDEAAAAADADVIMAGEEATTSTNKKSYHYVVPVSALETEVPVAAYSKSKSLWNSTGNFMVLANSLEKIPDWTAADETINLSIYDEELMFKAVNAYIEKDGSDTFLVFALSAKGYEDIFAGTFDEAMANGKNKDNWIHYAPATVECVYSTRDGEQNDGTAEKYQFRLPVTLNESGETRVPIVAISSSRVTKAEQADPENPDYSAAFTGRQALINLDDNSVIFGNYKGTVEVTVKTANAGDLNIDKKASLYTVGTPKANEYTCAPTLTMKDDVYDMAFIGTAEDAEKADEKDLIPLSADKTFTLTFQNSLGKTPMIKEGEAVDVAFRKAATSDETPAGGDTTNKAAAEWVGVKMLINTADETITVGVPVKEFRYLGTELNFVKADGTQFGMFTPQDGTKIEYGDDTITITFVPKTPTTYSKLAFGDINFPDTWTEPVEIKGTPNEEDGKTYYSPITLTLDKSYAGYAWPVAPIKWKDGGTTATQYYLTIPRELDFTVSVDGKEIEADNIEVIENGYDASYEDWQTHEKVESKIPLYVVTVPTGTTEADLTLNDFDDKYSVYYYTKDPDDSGYTQYVDYFIGEPMDETTQLSYTLANKAYKAKVTNDQVIRVQSGYDENWYSENLYAIAFKWVDFTVTVDGKEITDIEMIEDGYDASYEDWTTHEKVESKIPLYVVKVPAGTTEAQITLNNFCDKYSVYYYTKEPDDTGYTQYVDYFIGEPMDETTQLSYTLADKAYPAKVDGENVIRVQSGYDENWYSENLYAIAFEEAGAIRLFGDTRYNTSLSVAEELKAALGVEKFENIVLATGKKFPDALAGGYLANHKAAPIILINDGNQAVIDYIKANLSDKGTIYILGSEGAIPASWISGLKGLTIKRLGGSDRYATNIEILKEAGVKEGSEILVATGKKFADALSASAVDLPILLVNGLNNSLDKTQIDYLKGLGKCTFHILGGEPAVSKGIENALKTYGSVDRISGPDRYATSVEIAKKFYNDAKIVTLAVGTNFPDGLCGGVLACKKGAPLLLTADRKEADAAIPAFTSERGITSGYIYGGDNVLSAAVVQKALGGKAEITEKPYPAER